MIGNELKTIVCKIKSILIIACVLFSNLSCRHTTNTLDMGTSENTGVVDHDESDRTREGKITSDVAILIAKGLIAGAGVDLNLYRVEVKLDERNQWKVDFLLKERYRHFNVRCATVYINSFAGEVGEYGFHECNTPPIIEDATKSLSYSLPDGSIGIRIDTDPPAKYRMNDITPDEWGALFWDELGATDPNYAPGWEGIFSDSIPDYPTLSRVRGEYGSKVIFKGDEIDSLMNECIQIAKSAKNPIALDVVKRIIIACELAKKANTSVSFVGD